MGNIYPLPEDPNLNCLAVGFSCCRPTDTIKVFHATKQAIRRIEYIVREVNRITDGTDRLDSVEESPGYHKFQLKCANFNEGAGLEASTAGKLFVLRLLEEMYMMGYDPVVSSDLVREKDVATLFFKKVTEERQSRKVSCLAPGGLDKFKMLRGDELFVDTVKHAIQATWPGGIQKECILVSGTENVHEVKLHGTPWNDCDGEQNFRCNQMMIRLLGELGGVGYKLICGTNLKGTMDSFFFFKEESYRVGASDFCILSLNNVDLIRLIDCNDMSESVENAINKSEYKIQRISSEYGGIEFKLKGCPWNCSGVPAIESRRLLCRISEELLAQGWALTGALDLTRRPEDKSSLLFTRVIPFLSKFACIFLSNNNRIRFVDFPPDVTKELVDVVSNYYLPKISKIKIKFEYCHQVDLEGFPWDQGSGESSHGRSLMCYLLQAATRMNWQLVASADVSAKVVYKDDEKNKSADVHSWFLVYWPAGKSQL